MASRSYLADWECLIEPLKHELRQLGGVGFVIAAQTAMYHQRTPSSHERQRHEKTLFEELAKLCGPLQKASEYVNQMMHELEPHSPKRLKSMENPSSSQPPRNDYNSHKPTDSRVAAVTIAEGATVSHETSAEEDQWKGAGGLLYKVAQL